MKFSVATKPLAEALSLAIINANVNEYYQQSCVAQIQVVEDTLQINLEAAQLYSQVTLKGKCLDTPEYVSILVPCLTLKALVQSFDSSVVTFEFVDHTVILHSGKSKFTLAESIDMALNLKRPTEIPENTTLITVDKSAWAFIKNHQMYAASMSFVKPMYTRVCIRESGDVVVGDMDLSVFTHSTKSDIKKDCLLQTNIINLLTSLPDGAELMTVGDSYLIHVKTDGYEFLAEMQPESEEVVGSYNYDIVMSAFDHDENTGSTFDVAKVQKFLKQAELLGSNSESAIQLTVDAGTKLIVIRGDNVDCELDTQVSGDISYSMELPLKTFKDVITNLDADVAMMYPCYSGDNLVGAIFCTEEMSAVMAAAE